MITLNVREMPDELYRRMRIRVAEDGMTVRAFVFQAIEEKLSSKPLAVARTSEAPAWEKGENVADEKGKADGGIEPGGEVPVSGLEGGPVSESAAAVVSEAPVLRSGRPKRPTGYREAKIQKSARAKRASRFDSATPEAAEQEELGSVENPEENQGP